MVTKLGKEIRKLRIDSGENLASMSKKLGISISYLSAIENGLREVPPDFIDKLAKTYNLSKEEKEILLSAEACSANKATISLNSTLFEQKQLVFALSRKLKELTPEECSMILNLLEGDDHGK